MTVHPDADPRGHFPQIRPSSPAGSGDGAHDIQPSGYVRLVARLCQGRLDRMLAVGVPADPGSALAVHADRIVSFSEREAIARTLRAATRESHQPTSICLTARLQIHQANVAAAEAVIDDLALRLHSPLPVAARGMARLRLVLSDGLGPFYQHGRGDLRGRLGAARVAL